MEPPSHQLEHLKAGVEGDQVYHLDFLEPQQSPGESAERKELSFSMCSGVGWNRQTPSLKGSEAMPSPQRFRRISEPRRCGLRAAHAIVLLFLFGLPTPQATWAQTFEAPAFVTADETGAFCYDAIFTAGPGGFDIMIQFIGDSRNTDVPNIYIEPFCSDSLAEGKTISFSTGAPHCPGGIGGFLEDLTAEGSVSASISSQFGDLSCRDDGGQSFGARTGILPLEPVICFGNNTCAPGRYCQKAEGLCEESGTCSNRPESCSPGGTGVCGCNGITYDNTCTAAQAGTSIDFGGGPCLNVTPTPTATPTPTPTATPTATPTPPLTPCAVAWPLTRVVTIAKGQSSKDNPKVLHSITGYIVDPGSLDSRAHRIEVCAGTRVTAVVTDSTGTPTNTAARSLACDATGCSGIVNASEKYQAISQDGRDRDSITFIPK
jgi:hypothetical protein